MKILKKKKILFLAKIKFLYFFKELTIEKREHKEKVKKSSLKNKFQPSIIKFEGNNEFNENHFEDDNVRKERTKGSQKSIPPRKVHYNEIDVKIEFNEKNLEDDNVRKERTKGSQRSIPPRNIQDNDLIKTGIENKIQALINEFDGNTEFNENNLEDDNVRKERTKGGQKSIPPRKVYYNEINVNNEYNENFEDDARKERTKDSQRLMSQTNIHNNELLKTDIESKIQTLVNEFNGDNFEDDNVRKERTKGGQKSLPPRIVHNNELFKTGIESKIQTSINEIIINNNELSDNFEDDNVRKERTKGGQKSLPPRNIHNNDLFKTGIESKIQTSINEIISNNELSDNFEDDNVRKERTKGGQKSLPPRNVHNNELFKTDIESKIQTSINEIVSNNELFENSDSENIRKERTKGSQKSIPSRNIHYKQEVNTSYTNVFEKSTYDLSNPSSNIKNNDDYSNIGKNVSSDKYVDYKRKY